MKWLFFLLCFTVVLHAIPYDANLAAYWSMNQTSGNTMIDATGLNSGTLYNMSSPSGWSNQALRFDGVNDYVIVNHDGRLTYNSGDFSVGVWANPSTIGIYTGLLSTDIAGDQAWKIFMDVGQNHFRARYNQLILEFPTITAGVWHHYGYVKSGNTLSIYLDGQFIASGTTTTTHPVSTSELVLGSYRINDARNGYYYYQGLMDEMGIWNRALSSAEMQNVYLSVGPSVPEPASFLCVLLSVGIVCMGRRKRS